jgi:hypothetical protein
MSQMDIKIEKDVPLPNPKQHGGKWLRILLEMEVGDSFMVTEEMMGDHKTMESCRSSIAASGQRSGLKLTFRTLAGAINCSGGFRVWLVDKKGSPK